MSNQCPVFSWKILHIWIVLNVAVLIFFFFGEEKGQESLLIYVNVYKEQLISFLNAQHCSIADNQ